MRSLLAALPAGARDSEDLRTAQILVADHASARQQVGVDALPADPDEEEFAEPSGS